MFRKGLCLTITPLLALVAALPASAQEVVQAGQAPVDQFHPDNQPKDDGSLPEQPTPLYGGRVIVHLASMPENLNYVIENSAVTRRMLYEVHEFLLLQDWETHEYVPKAAREFVREDMLVLKAGAESKYEGVVSVLVKDRSEGAEDGAQRQANVLYGQLSESGDNYVLKPSSKGSDLGAETTVAKADVDSVEKGAVFTFYLRENVQWHPAEGIEGHTLDARDVHFSWSIYSNAKVDCDEKRFNFEKITRADIVDDMTIRFFYDSQYFGAVHTMGVNLTLLPSHIYDLSDPDNPQHDPDASADELAEFINTNPHNSNWVGLGPYRVTDYTQQWIQAERFDGYWNPDDSGYFDTIRWRLIDDDNAALQAVYNGELDYFERVKSTDYFGEATAKKEFTDKFYKGYKYLGMYGYTGWNMYRPQLKEKVVRQAIAHAFDFQDYRATNYKNLCNQITGPFPYNSAAYDHSVKPYPYDPDTAEEMLDDAGWYDSNGDGVRDKDGVELVIEFMMPSGNDASKNFGLKLQESLAEIGIKINMVPYEWATFLDKFKNREFDGANLAWVPELESDPEQLWHSKWGAYDKRSSNNSGVMEPELDKLILAGQLELDHAKRQKIWHQMHSFLYDLQPYLFMYNVPNKFAMSKRIRGFQAFAIDPGYSIRRWYFVDPAEPGTRKTRERSN